MFTGLVETTGTLTAITELGEQSRFTVRMPFASELSLGDSVAHNGCCLTVAAIDGELISLDILRQTLDVTSLVTLVEGDTLNLERALLPTQRLGGHFVQGHVDGTGKVLDLSQHGQDHRFEVSLPDAIAEFCIDKGSLAVDGISLTIAELKEKRGATSAVFWITPHTYESTNLHSIAVGHTVNLEADILAKYTKKLLNR